jgi:hypothetical protein
VLSATDKKSRGDDSCLQLSPEGKQHRQGCNVKLDAFCHDNSQTVVKESFERHQYALSEISEKTAVSLAQWQSAFAEILNRVR